MRLLRPEFDGGSDSALLTGFSCGSVWEFVCGDEGFECGAGVLEGGALVVADGVFRFFPDVFCRVQAGAVGR